MTRKLSDRLLLVCAPWLGAKLIRIIALTQKSCVYGEDRLQQLWQSGQQVILSTWHDQLLMMVTIYRGPGAKILISQSKDGELIARTVAYFGQQAVRGSSSRGGRAAFRELMKLSAEKNDLAVTPDGPKGPKHVIKDGVVQLARLSGRPVVPLTYVCSRGHRFKSWDRFLLPFPFARSVYVFGEPVYLERDADMDQCRKQLQKAMDETHSQAKHYLEISGVSAV